MNTRGGRCSINAVPRPAVQQMNTRGGRCSPFLQLTTFVASGDSKLQLTCRIAPFLGRQPQLGWIYIKKTDTDEELVPRTAASRSGCRHRAPADRRVVR
jgi:hypothetical protein